jgi:hypothetical protein
MSDQNVEKGSKLTQNQGQKCGIKTNPKSGSKGTPKEINPKINEHNRMSASRTPLKESKLTHLGSSLADVHRDTFTHVDDLGLEDHEDKNVDKSRMRICTKRP